MDSPNLETAARFNASATSHHQCAEVHHQLQLSVMRYHRAGFLAEHQLIEVRTDTLETSAVSG